MFQTLLLAALLLWPGVSGNSVAKAPLSASVVVPLSASLAVPLESIAVSAAIQDDPLQTIGARLEALFSGQPEDATSFLENYTPALREKMTDAQLLAVLAMFQRDLVDAKLQLVDASAPNEGELVFYSAKSGLGARFEITLEDVAPFRITGLGCRLEPGEPIVEGLEDGMSTDDMARVIDAFVSKLASEDRFSGTVLLAKDGEVVFEKAWGLASRRYDVPNTIDTRFNLGSMNKMFTAVAIAQLAQAGKLDFDDKLIKHLPNYPNKAVAESVTLDQLLTHTSGMGSFWDALDRCNWTKLREPADYLDLFANDELLFAPGERFSYSNSGFTVLGLVIEAVSGQSYFDYIREHIYAPAGMVDSDSFAMDEPVKRLAIGYTRMDDSGELGDGPLRNNDYLHRMRGGPEGGGFSTVHDLLEFANALLANKLLGAEATANLLRGRSVTGWGDNNRYAYGFITDSQAGHAMLGHSGGAPGINAALWVFPADGYTLAVLCNCDDSAAYVAHRIQEMIVRSSQATK